MQISPVFRMMPVEIITGTTIKRFF